MNIQNNKPFVIAAGVLILIGLIGAVGYTNSKKKAVQSHRSYSLNLMEGMAYNPNEPSELMFSIKDENNNVLKSFDTVHEKLLHLIVVRKDRTNFQHVHPKFDPSTGMFAITGFNFPTDGGYRVFADFTPTDSQKDAMGTKLAATPFKDVQVGTGSYVAQTPLADKLASAAGGLDTSVSFPPADDSPGGGLLDKIYAGSESSINISVKKNGAAFTNLQNYLGALGHMVILGPNLEFIHAHPMDTDSTKQTGLISFMVNFPNAGRYVAYLQTQTEGKVNTTDYAVSVLPPPASGSNTNSSMPGMNHTSH